MHVRLEDSALGPFIPGVNAHEIFAIDRLATAKSSILLTHASNFSGLEPASTMPRPAAARRCPTLASRADQRVF